MVEKSVVEKFLVAKSGVESSGVEASGVEMSFNCISVLKTSLYLSLCQFTVSFSAGSKILAPRRS